MTFPVSTPCWFDSSEVGAPTLNNTAGSLLEVLRACLINGFGAVSVTSIVVAGGVATATAATHGFSSAYGKLVLIEGAPVAALNGRKRIENVLTNTFTYPAPGVADGTYTGTISARRAPLGWTEPHSGTNRAIFARTSPEASGSLLRVEDTRVAPAAATYAHVVQVESASGVDTFTNRVPTADADGPFWCVGVSNATAKRWTVVGDDKRFFIAIQQASADLRQFVYFFGDPTPLYPGDAGRCLLATHSSTTMSNATAGLLRDGAGDIALAAISATNLHFQRTLNALTVGVRAAFAGVGAWGSTGTTDTAAVIPVAGDFLLRTGTEIRARMPALYSPHANNLLTSGSIMEVPGYADKQFLVLDAVRGTVGAQPLIDLTGPWD